MSRWGRFQDPDEAAHYEFLCKAARVKVHYCAEHFGNDGHPASLILKTLKRVMAAEYSRELSEKLFAGMTPVVKSGFRTAAHPGYGFRRMLVSTDAIPRQQLSTGERKSITTDRVILVPRPAHDPGRRRIVPKTKLIAFTPTTGIVGEDYGACFWAIIPCTITRSDLA
jgi:hypothetical protein